MIIIILSRDRDAKRIPKLSFGSNSDLQLIEKRANYPQSNTISISFLPSRDEDALIFLYYKFNYSSHEKMKMGEKRQMNKTIIFE